MLKTEIITTIWNKLQCLSCEHSFRLWKTGSYRSKYHRGVTVPEDIQENVDILGRSNESEIKTRIFWYITFHPDIFDTCSKSGWKING
jgi:hypothetical protein